MNLVAAFVAGLLFGVGLVVSQMIDPAKVLGFLDIAGDWDPSLGFVMAGALAVAAPGYILARRLLRPLCADEFASPATAEVDQRLIIGALLFGAGWGLVGYCPGPALASLGFGNRQTLLFVIAMLGGMAAYAAFDRYRRATISRASTP